MAQAQLDNATLAAASLRYDADESPSSIVSRYMEKAAVIGVLNVNVDNNSIVGAQIRSITTHAYISVPTMVLNLVGVDVLQTTISSTAIEKVPNIEMSLALDISDSMAADGKMDALKPAAKAFVTRMLNSNDLDNPNRVSISTIPFNRYVSAGEDLFMHMASDKLEHDYSYCLDFEQDAFKSRQLLTNNGDARHAANISFENIADITAIRGWDFKYSYGYVDNPLCITKPAISIVPFSKNEDQLHNQIDDLTIFGGTSQDIAVKWATALLDPSSRQAVTNIVNSTDEKSTINIDEGFEGRPVDYSDPGTLKIIVLMSDGANSSGISAKDDFRGTKPSDVYKDDSGELVFESDDTEVGPDWMNLTWADVWGLIPFNAYNQQSIVNFDRGWLVAMENLDFFEKDKNLSEICSAAKFSDEENNGILIFTVAFESDSTRGEESLKDCSSGNGFHYVATTETIDEIFMAIANQIQKLKLVK
jgi:hypothetical protein